MGYSTVLLVLVFSLSVAALFPVAYAGTVATFSSPSSLIKTDCTSFDASPYSSSDDISISTFFKKISSDLCVMRVFVFDVSEYPDETQVLDSRLEFTSQLSLSNSTVVSSTCSIYFLAYNGMILNDLSENDLDTVFNDHSTPLKTNFDCSSKLKGKYFSLDNNPTLIQKIQTQIDNDSPVFSVYILPNFAVVNDNDNGLIFSILDILEPEISITSNIPCWRLDNTSMCNLFKDPWDALGQAFGKEWIGDWFYLLIFMPFPMVIFITTKNGGFAGLATLIILVSVNTIDQLVLEVVLTLIFICVGFGLYELYRKRLIE